MVRTFTYDTLGRRLSSDDPDTDNGADASETTSSWRYLYNKVNDLVAVRDPRGCGQNFFYDHAGRLRGEQYVGCGEAQTSAAETPPASNSVSGLIAMAELSGSVSLDTVYHYDEYPGWASPPVGLSGTQGRATGVTDRGQRAAVGYDDRGHAVWTSRQLALIPSAPLLNAIVTTNGRPTQTEQAATAGAVVYDAAHTYERTASFDHAGRPTSMALPTDPDYAGTAPSVGGTLTYNARGLPSSALLTLDASSVTIVEAIGYLRDGLVSSVTYGDDLSGTRTPTTSTTAYDARRRPVRMTTTRTPLTGHATGSGEELEAVTTVFDQQLVWDAANNLVRQVDHRDPGEWPAGFRPQSVDITHDALYRVVGADYEYTQADGSRTTVDSATDWRTQLAESSAAAVDPMNPQPAPLVSSAASARVVSLTWEWDYLANTTEWTDDQRQFYERSIGNIANGNDLDSAERPSALYLSSDISGGVGGWLEVDYGAGGNVTAMTVHGQCTNNGGATCADPGGASLSSRLSALRADCTCAVEQHYAYRWDELNRIVEARRYDGSAGGGWTLEARERYRYDGANQRVVKQSVEQDSCLAPPVAGSGVIPCERTALYPYPGDFERRGLYADGATGSYEPTGAGTETQYVVAGARVVWANGSPGTGFDRDARVTVPVADLIQTSAAVFDVRSGALLEASTYYPNGGRETFLNDDTGLVAAEPSGFTGKEAEEEVGVVYFGERWLIPRIGRWASPDPLHVHAVGGGEALNSYHYVSGNLLSARDPLGLNAPPRAPPRTPRGGGSRTRVPGGRRTGTGGGPRTRAQTARDLTARLPDGSRVYVPETSGDAVLQLYRRGRERLREMRDGVAPPHAEAGPKLPVLRQRLARVAHLRELGLDPVTGQYEAGEARTGARLEAFASLRLRRGGATEGDWVDTRTGTSYDAVGGDGPRGEFRSADFRAALSRHLRDYDRAVVDYNEFHSAENIAQVRSALAELSVMDRARVVEIPLGPRAEQSPYAEGLAGARTEAEGVMMSPDTGSGPTASGR